MKALFCVRWGLCAILGTGLLTACDTAPDLAGTNAEDANTGTVIAEITQVPSGVQCIRLTLTGVVSKNVDYNNPSGPSAPMTISTYVPAGSLAITPYAYNVQCSAVTSTTTPNWVGSSVTTTVGAGGTTQVSLVLRPYVAVTASVDFSAGVKAIAAGSRQTYALLSDGTVRSWGYNANGQLGANSTAASSNTSLNVLTGSPPAKLSNIVSIGAGFDFGCALDASGQAYCWGLGTRGQLGNGSGVSSLLAVPVLQSNGPFKQLAVGESHACGIIASGAVYCWGWNTVGEVGDGTTNQRNSPVEAIKLEFLVPADPSAMLVMGGQHTALLAGDAMNGVGDNSHSSDFGTGDLRSCLTGCKSGVGNPIGFAAGVRFLLGGSARYLNVCMIEASAGNVYCAGDNSHGQLGNGTTTASLTPVLVSGLNNVTAVSLGGISWDYTLACALKADQTVSCWGVNDYGSLGDGTETTRYVPTPVKGLSGAIGIAAGDLHTCALKNDGSVWCWGLGSDGELGDGTWISKGLPTRVLF